MAKEHFESLSVANGSKKQVKFQVDVVNSILRSVFLLFYFTNLTTNLFLFSFFSWEFMTDSGDIAFRVFTKDAELLPTNKVESHLVMEEGEITCESKGECKFCHVLNKEIIVNCAMCIFFYPDVVEFDNSFSFIKSKKVRYSIVVLPPS